jgi:hypothetical protein
MHVQFTSSHVARDGSGTLRIDVATEHAARQMTLFDQLTFSVPADYHAHNDLVAAALLTLIGRTASHVTFNFPISSHCATTLRAYYRLREVGPVDASLEPRQPGRYLGLNFSGGTDSTAAWLLLTGAGVDFKVITSDYGGYYAREELGYGRARRDITCATNFRVKGYERNLGRFNGAVPLLFADYLDLSSIATGHNMFQNPLSIEAVGPGQQPAFRLLEPAFTAGGLEEVHLVRSLSMVGTLAILLQAGPEMVESAFAASSDPSTWKYFSKAMLTQWICARMRLPLPEFLRDLPTPTRGDTGTDDLSWGIMAAVLSQRGELTLPDELTPMLAHYPTTLGEIFTMDWYFKYHPEIAMLVPRAWRNAFLNQFHTYGIYPYAEADWQELVLSRQLVCDAKMDANSVMPEMCRPAARR